MKRTTTLTIEVEYDDAVTDSESLAVAFDRLLETSLSIPGIMDDYGNPEVGEFWVQDKGWVVRNVVDDSIWSNKDGFVLNPDDATFFTDEEMTVVDLPMYGEWVRLTHDWETDLRSRLKSGE